MVGKVIEGRYAGASINKIPDKNVLYVQTEDGARIALSKNNAISIDDVTDQYPCHGTNVVDYGYAYAIDADNELKPGATLMAEVSTNKAFTGYRIFYYGRIDEFCSSLPATGEGFSMYTARTAPNLGILRKGQA